MTIQELIILLSVGLTAGILSGTLGVGGGIVAVPALVFFLGMTQHQALGTSLFFMLPPIGLLGAMNYYRAGYVNIKYALILVVAFFIGNYLGSVISIHLPDNTLRKLFGLFFFLIGLKMFIK